jgi:uncharacterized membrane-anchored protein YhcB (DUF1043 family)
MSVGGCLAIGFVVGVAVGIVIEGWARREFEKRS